MITPEMIEAGARALAKRRGHNPDWPVGVNKHGYAQEPYVREVPSWEWFCKADAEAALTAALSLASRPIDKGEIAGLIELVKPSRSGTGVHLQDRVLTKIEAALRSLVLEVERLKKNLQDGNERAADTVVEISLLSKRIAELKDECDRLTTVIVDGQDRRDRDIIRGNQQEDRAEKAEQRIVQLEAALAAARNKTIEECAKEAETCGFETPIRIAQCIRALAIGETKPSEDRK